MMIDARRCVRLVLVSAFAAMALSLSTGAGTRADPPATLPRVGGFNAGGAYQPLGIDNELAQNCQVSGISAVDGNESSQSGSSLVWHKYQFALSCNGESFHVQAEYDPGRKTAFERLDPDSGGATLRDSWAGCYTDPWSDEHVAYGQIDSMAQTVANGLGGPCQSNLAWSDPGNWSNQYFLGLSSQTPGGGDVGPNGMADVLSAYILTLASHTLFHTALAAAQQKTTIGVRPVCQGFASDPDPTITAPVIAHPTAGETFALAQGAVTLQLAEPGWTSPIDGCTTKYYTVRFEHEDGGVWKLVTVDTLAAVFGVESEPMSALGNQSGQWRLSAWVAWPQAPISPWVEFDISTGQPSATFSLTNQPQLQADCSSTTGLPLSIAAPTIQFPQADQTYTLFGGVPVYLTSSYHDACVGYSFDLQWEFYDDYQEAWVTQVQSPGAGLPVSESWSASNTKPVNVSGKTFGGEAATGVNPPGAWCLWARVHTNPTYSGATWSAGVPFLLADQQPPSGTPAAAVKCPSRSTGG
jgi:hypothetical protein